jgi:endonuclease YncB( thermonuclease family)
VRPPATIAFTLSGLVLFAVAALALVPASEPEHEAASAEPTAVQPAPARLASREPKLPEESQQEETSSIRRIAPSVVAVPPFQPRGLTREPPRRSVASLAPEPQKPEFTKLFRPVASAAGRMRIDGREIEIAGIKILEPDRTCEHADGSTWPCGMRARTAFRAWLRGRAVDCRLGSAETDEVLTTDCRLGGDDIGQWLVENGWAPAVADGPYAEAGKRAEDEALGIFARE